MVDRRARYRRVMILALAGLACAAWATACGDDAVAPSPPPPPEPARPTSIAVEPSSATLMSLGETAVFRATVKDQRGAAFPGTVTWSSSDEAVFTVDVGGRATAVANGSGTVTATVQSLSATAAVQVAQEAGSLDVLSGGGQTADLETPLPEPVVVRVSDAGGSPVAGAAVVFAPGEGHGTVDPAEAVTDGEGLARTGWTLGKTVGEQTLVATVGDVSETILAHTVNPDRAALVALYEATDGPNWVDNTNWLTDAPLGEWYGVETDASGRVVRLDLHGRSDGAGVTGNGLVGSIPPQLGNLAKLVVLNLQRNSLPGVIPPELGKLAKLEVLLLDGNRLQGSIPPELGNLVHLEDLRLDSNLLGGTIPPELGNLTELSRLRLDANALEGAIPARLGSLTNLRRLLLSGNSLAGPIPPELGNLVALQLLSLHDNQLTGAIPSELGNLVELSYLSFEGNEGLCAPGNVSFADWLGSIERSWGPFCNDFDRGVLKSLFEAAGGSAWTNADGWLGGPALAGWHGVRVDSLGHVTALDLRRNGLAGQLPASLGDLGRMTELDIADNAGLTGRLPLALARRSLKTLRYSGTDLCAPSDAYFRDWLNGIPSHDGTGVECAPPSDREILEIFYEATGGPQWTNSDGWMTDAPLRDWHGVRVDREGRVFELLLYKNNLTGSLPAELGSLTRLNKLVIVDNPNLAGIIPPDLGQLARLDHLQLSFNALEGPIPPTLGDLTNLDYLDLWGNDLSGSIPPSLGQLAGLSVLGLGSNVLDGSIPSEIGSLSRLKTLHLFDNVLTGSIPQELGRLASVESILLWGNALTGSIPPELGTLASAEVLSLDDNQLSGPIPSELGNLQALWYLGLGGNALTGPLPSELGRLSTLEVLVLDRNDLTDNVPSEFSRMSSLEELSLTNNPGMEGRLPEELTSLRRLEAFLAQDTGLCAPGDPGFQTWLEGVHKRRIMDCAEADPAAAYLTQAVQSREFPVPLVAGDKALLRVFPVARQATSQGIPAVRARFYLHGRETHVESIPGKSAPIPTEVDESSLLRSANAEIPGHVVQPGLEMVVEVDPEGTLDPALGVATRIPAEGRLSVEVRAMPLFDLTLIPFVWTETRDSSVVDLVEAVAMDPGNHEMLAATRTLLPVGDLAVTAHEPVLSSSNSAFTIHDETKAIRAMEGGTGHYMGMMSPPVTGAAGVAFLPGRSSFSIPEATTMAHELGHNMNLQHAPCGATGDPSYPYPDGSIGAWGYDFNDGGRLVHPQRPDLMSYCGPRWMGDYGFSNALRYRLFDEGPPSAATVAAPGRSLLVWGGIGADTVPYLEPAFVVEAPPTLPDSAGEYEVTGRTAGGAELFSLSFAMPGVADGDGSSSFAFVLPVRSEWDGRLASITLTGPRGSAVLDRDTDRPMAILRNPGTGQVRGFLRDVRSPGMARAAADAAGSSDSSLDMHFSRGIPDFGN